MAAIGVPVSAIVGVTLGTFTSGSIGFGAAAGTGGDTDSGSGAGALFNVAGSIGGEAEEPGKEVWDVLPPSGEARTTGLVTAGDFAEIGAGAGTTGEVTADFSGTLGSEEAEAGCP